MHGTQPLQSYLAVIYSTSACGDARLPPHVLTAQSSAPVRVSTVSCCPAAIPAKPPRNLSNVVVKQESPRSLLGRGGQLAAMFGKHLFRHLRSALEHRGMGQRRSGGIQGGQGPAPSSRAARMPLVRHVASAAAAGGGLVHLLARAPHTYKIGTALLVSGGAVTAYNSNQTMADLEDAESSQIGWVQDLATQEGVSEVLVPGQMLRKHPVGQLLSEEDHLFDTMQRSEQIKEFRCFWDSRVKQFHSVVLLGREVCGYPATVHGGLTAAIMDETLGGLYTCLLTSGHLGVRLPGLTARLEVDYKKKIPAGTTLLVSTEVESVVDRKVWMKATVSDGQGAVFATGRALFVSPNVTKHLARLGNWKENAAGAVQQQGGRLAVA